MAFGLNELARSIEATGKQIPEWLPEALKRADEADVLRRLTEDACSGIALTLQIQEIPVRLFGRQILTLGPATARLWGCGPSVARMAQDESGSLDDPQGMKK